MSKIDFSKHKAVPTIYLQPFNVTIVETISHSAQEIPDKIEIIVATT